MRLKSNHIILIAVALITLLGAACKKQKIQTVGGTLTFSTDTLKFDTVFTAAGSFTNAMLIYNPQNEEVILSSVQLARGGNSYFHLNVDGFSGNTVTNLKIAAHDSLYVFATVNIDPSNANNPFVITDSLVATLNGKNFYVPFTAYGQNAHYIVSDSIRADSIWLTDKPYVVIHSCVVGPGATLNIPANCKVYMHQDARFFVYGALNVDTSGVPGMDSVVFQGDRLDRAYFGYIGYPGEWGGFYFIQGSKGRIKNAVIKNCGGPTTYNGFTTQPAAIEVDSTATLYIDHSLVENSFGYGIFSWAGNTTATSCLVSTTGMEALAIIEGGNDSITNCTFANYGTAAVTHASNGTVTIVNYLNNGAGAPPTPGNLNAVLRNCIVYGSLDSEVIFDSVSSGTAKLLVDHCLLKMGSVLEGFVTFTGYIFNEDPLFKDPNNGDFHLTTGSPAIGAGTNVPGLSGLAPLYGTSSWWFGQTMGSGVLNMGCY